MNPRLRLLALMAITASGTCDAANLGCSPDQFLLEGLVVQVSGESKVRIQSDSGKYAFVKVQGPVKKRQRLLGCLPRIEADIRQDPDSYIVIVPPYNDGPYRISVYRRGARWSIGAAADECLRSVNEPLVEPAGKRGIPAAVYLPGEKRPSPEQLEESRMGQFKWCFEMLTK